MEHYFLAPSSASKWVKCSASPTAEDKYPQEPTEDTENGKAAHWVCSEVLNSYKTGNLKLCSDFIGESAPNSVIITDEMSEAAEVYTNEILKVCQRLGMIQELHIEEQIKIERVHSELNGGTPDCWAHHTDSNTIYSWDFKYGHKYVDIFENWQMIDYNIGIVDKVTNSNGLLDQTLNLVMTIIQPRCYQASFKIRSWTIMGSDLRGYANQLYHAADLATGSSCDITYTTGDHCLGCSARHVCPGAQRAAMGAIDVTNMTGNLNELDAQSLGLELSYLKRAESLLKARITGLELHVESVIMSGIQVPGWDCEPTHSALNWDKPTKEVITMGNMFGYDLSNNKAITPYQAIAKGIDQGVIKAYSSKKATGFKLIKHDENLAKKVFG